MQNKTTLFQSTFTIQSKPEFSIWEIVCWDNRRQEYTIQSTSLPSQRLVVPPKATTALSPWCHFALLHQLSSPTTTFHLTHQSRCSHQPRRVSLLLNYFAECLQKSSHLMLLLFTNPSLTTLSSSFLSSKKIRLSRMQQLINHLLDRHLFCVNLSNIKRGV